VQAYEGGEATQTQADQGFSSNITRQQLQEKEEQFKVRYPDCCSSIAGCGVCA
jgi:hypothetical protein